MEQLRIIADSFPKVGSAAAVKDTQYKLAPCGCPRRSPPPEVPPVLPFNPLVATAISKLHAAAG